MAAQEIIANLAAQVRRLMAEHAKLRGLCDRMKTEGDALRKENRTLQERVRSLEEELSCVRLAEGLVDRLRSTVSPEAGRRACRRRSESGTGAGACQPFSAGGRQVYCVVEPAAGVTKP